MRIVPFCCCYLVLALGCRSAADAPPSATHAIVAQESSRLDALLPPAKHALTLRATPDAAPSLQDVLLQLESATGVHVLAGADERAQLRRASSGLLSDLEVPPSQAWRVVETMLVENGFFVDPSSGAEPVTIALVSTSVPRSGTFKERAVEVDESELAACAHHPAVIFMVVLDLDALDARQLATSLRQLFPDQQTQSILPITGSQLLLVGLGPQLVEMAGAIRTANAMRKRDQEDAARNPQPADAVAAPR